MTSGVKQGSLRRRVKAVWRRAQLLRFAEGGLVFMRWALTMFFAGALLDWLADLPVPGRAAVLLTIVVIPLYKAWQAGWKYVRPFNATHTALQIEERKGGMESLLVTALQLGDTARRHGTSDALCDLTCRKAEESAGEIRAKEAVSFKALRDPAVVALIVILLFGVLVFTNGPLLLAGLGRIFAPWLAISYPTRTQLEMVSGDIVVQEGKSVRLAANISGVVPRKAKLALRTEKGKARIRKLAIVDGECEYVIDTAFRGFEYRLTAGDARSLWHTVEVINSPNIERAELTLEFPDYIERPAETVEALTITVPETTRVHWKLTLDRAVREASMKLAGQDPVPLKISSDGRVVELQQVATESRAYGFSWIEREHGFSFTSPNHYMQVAPDRPPSVELTSPRRNVYATLGRKMDLTFRGRDDHGIAESAVAYRVDKTEEEKVPFTPGEPIDGTEQTIDWDYRLALTNLVVGQSMTFAVELADAYPGEKGPHRSRSEARRIQFMSREDYLAQIEKQKKRLLSQLRTIYREEREVHEVVMRLDRDDPIFVQTCQLEAVRQDLMRERLKKLAGRMRELTEDLAANSITNVPAIGTLASLRSDLVRISQENISKAAGALRSLASESGRKRNGGSAQAHAAHMVNSSARELGLLVLQLGFEDAAEVMAREMHAAAETQGALRLKTITAAGNATELAAAQERLGKWLSRLFAASPKGKESTINDALIEFTLTRIVKRLVNGGIDKRMQDAAAAIRGKKPGGAASLQSEVIADLLKAEFRLRVGAEREALAKAMKLFVAQAEEQEKLRLAIKGLGEKDFKKERAAMAQAQTDLHSKLQMLLMPGVPAPRTRLFDDTFPPPPPINNLLVSGDEAMTAAESHIRKGDRKAAEKAQQKAEASFASLAEMTRKRIVAMTQAVRIERLAFASLSVDEKLGGYGERQLSLLEKTEDSAAEGTKSVYLAEQEEALADAVDELRIYAEERVRDAGTPSEQSQALPVRVGEAVDAMRQAVPLLKQNTPKDAIRYEKAAILSITNAQNLLAEHGRNISMYAAMLSSTRLALQPAPYVAEIEEEQRDMLALTRKLKPDDMPKYAIPQKNLVHAVDAILVALDPIAHVVQSGTVMLFAKEDMDSAGEALAIKDIEEALDAQEYIVETLEKLRGQIEAVVPQFQYMLEVVEALHEVIPEGVLIREAQRRIREGIAADSDASKIAAEQAALVARTEQYGKLVNEVTGLGYIDGALRHMREAQDLLKKGDKPAAAARMAQAEGSLAADTASLLTIMKNFGAVFNAPPVGGTLRPEVVLLRDVLALAAVQKRTHRESHAANAKQLPGLEAKLREFARQCDPFIELAKTHKNPVAVEAPKPVPPANFQRHLIAAKGTLVDAAAGAKASRRATMLAGQKEGTTHLRHFIVEYTLKFSIPPPPPPPQDPAPSDEFNESEDLMNLFMPGAVTGKRPPDGKLEWEVLGRRDRAALNENFARELPLEYRAILKDYYERLAR